mgnify:CR=1 FL=1
MSNTNWSGAIVSVVLALIVGGLISYVAFPQVQTVTNTVTKTIEVPKEVQVIKEVPVAVDYQKEVIDRLIAEIPNDKELRTCSHRKYDADEVIVKKVFDGFRLVEDSYGDTSITDVKATLYYNDGECTDDWECKINTRNELICSN